MHANRITSVGALKPVIPATFMGGMTRSDGEEVRDCPDVPVSDFGVWQRVWFGFTNHHRRTNLDV